MSETDELVRRWQAGWSLSQGWTSMTEDDGVLSVAIGSDAVEHVVVDADGHRERVLRAARLARTGTGPGWVTVVTRQPGSMAGVLQDLGLRIEQHPEWLMTIDLLDQAPAAPPPGCRVSTETEAGDPTGILIAASAVVESATVAVGQLAVIGRDAIADRIETRPQHRRRGLASAVMSALVDSARGAGAKRGILVASTEGRDLYLSLGWRIVGDVVIGEVG
ncbi:hypothetical protein GCM10009841_35750 [Microlunatus panaciterrae]|uniref:GNAT superfamily N-acetyltransferase n=1 Tax=Microlunatus panaciterrae TaxID=400768 RepID=A0ABS2RHN8_9ACTN|nr:GNAT family N-acetyltransferase [Microlunatus panaciterrae]MBM7798233.1 GNAT superfamily N-acetyltransferase [Microlunatus panaciterrae]